MTHACVHACTIRLGRTYDDGYINLCIDVTYMCSFRIARRDASRCRSNKNKSLKVFVSTRLVVVLCVDLEWNTNLQEPNTHYMTRSTSPWATRQDHRRHVCATPPTQTRVHGRKNAYNDQVDNVAWRMRCGESSWVIEDHTLSVIRMTTQYVIVSRVVMTALIS